MWGRGLLSMSIPSPTKKLPRFSPFQPQPRFVGTSDSCGLASSKPNVVGVDTESVSNVHRSSRLRFALFGNTRGFALNGQRCKRKCSSERKANESFPERRRCGLANRRGALDILDFWRIYWRHLLCWCLAIVIWPTISSASPWGVSQNILDGISTERTIEAVSQSVFIGVPTPDIKAFIFIAGRYFPAEIVRGIYRSTALTEIVGLGGLKISFTEIKILVNNWVDISKIQSCGDSYKPSVPLSIILKSDDSPYLGRLLIVVNPCQRASVDNRGTVRKLSDLLLHHNGVLHYCKLIARNESVGHGGEGDYGGEKQFNPVVHRNPFYPFPNRQPIPLMLLGLAGIAAGIAGLIRACVIPGGTKRGFFVSVGILIVACIIFNHTIQTALNGLSK
jgi:hypothetical protein